MEKTCINFKGDRPCNFYWSEELYKNKPFSCSKKCKFYKKIEKRIILIKLDAIGDVLRTTPLAEGIKKKFPSCQLTWLVAESGFKILKNNPHIDRILIYNPENANALQSEYFDLLINLDKDKKATFLANKIHSYKKKGFLLSKYGVPFPVNAGAVRLYNLALDNWGEKKRNKKNFQEMIFETAEIPYNGEEYFLKLDEEDIKYANEFKKKLEKNKHIIGINSGCGPKYPYKKWTKQGIISLINKLTSQNKQVILFGGPDEIRLNKEIKSKTSVIDAGCNNPVTQFAALINICDVLFTGDTFALHLGIALKKPVVAIFGPTPAQEIKLYKGKKITANVPCINCYNQFPCIMDKKGEKNCMESISVQEVLDTINKFL